MSHQGKYSGKVVSEDKTKVRKGKFNWSALGFWLLSLVISLIPIYISLVQHLIKTDGVITHEFWFACFKEYDILWIFATVLLFSCMNQLTIERKIRESKRLLKTFTIIGFGLFAFLEATWIVYKYWLVNFQSWPITFGTILIIAAMIIATPLQIDFIKYEE